MKSKSLWENYNLTIVLFLLFLISWIIQTWMGWREFSSEQIALGQVPEIFGPDGYIWTWGVATFENWQSEFLQLFTFVFLTAFLIHKGSPESRDGDDEIRGKLDRIEKQLSLLTSKANP